PGFGVANPSSFSGINDPNTPTYLISRPLSTPTSQATPVPPNGTSSHGLSMPPTVPSITPVLPLSTTGPVSQIPPTIHAMPLSSQMAGPQPMLPPISTTGPVSQIPPTVHAMPLPSQMSGPQPVIEMNRAVPVAPQRQAGKRPFMSRLSEGNRRAAAVALLLLA